MHCIHFPLAADRGLSAYVIRGTEKERKKYTCDISFIGNLYNGGNNRYRKASFGKENRQYLENLISEQTMQFEENILRKNLQNCKEAVNELTQKCNLTLGAEYFQDDVQLATDVVGMEVSARERERVLGAISRRHPLRLYTSSNVPESLWQEGLERMGYADYEKELPLIYHYSRINLNITSKTISSGVPQRVFDILACRGFCLTNYQEEIAEYFEEGKHLVMFRSEEELLDKAGYYLEHDNERRQIAENGYMRVMESFELRSSIGRMLEYLYNF